MLKNIVIAVLGLFLVASNLFWVNLGISANQDIDSHVDLEVEVRENAILDLSEIVLQQNREKGITELVEVLRKEFGSELLAREDNIVYFKSIKFQFQENRLEKVFW